MSLYYEAATIEQVKAAFDTLNNYADSTAGGGLAPFDRAWGGPSNHYLNSTQRLSDVRAAYSGGQSAALRFLRPKPGESPDQLKARRQLVQNVPLVRTYVSGRAGMLYGVSPERCVEIKDAQDDDTTSEELDLGVNRVFERSNHKSLFRKSVIEAAIRDEYSVVKIRPEGDDTLRLSFLPCENVLFIVRPDDINTCLGVVEIRRNGQTFEYYMWTLLEHGPITDKWRWIGKPEVNEWELIPYVCFGQLPVMRDRQRVTEDIVMDQRNLINVRSANALAMRSQTFSTAVTTGVVTGPFFTGEDGQQRLMVGPEAAVELAEGGTYEYKNPNIDLKALLDSELRQLKQALELYGVSGFTVDQSGAPDQPMALLIKMFKPLLLRREDAALFEPAERQLCESIASMGARMGMWTPEAVDPDSLNVEINYSEAILPMDREAEKASDLAAVAAGVKLREDYVKKWSLEEGATEEEVREYMARLDEEAKARASAGMPSRGSGLNIASALMARMDAGKAPNENGAPTQVQQEQATP